MKKKLLFVALLVSVLIAGLFLGSKSGASSDWSNELTSIVNKELGATGFEKKEEILQSDVTAEMKETLDPKIAAEQAELEAMLEAYYQMKLDGLTDTAEYAALEAQIEAIKLNIFNRYKAEIDTMFDGA
ncbi:MAG: hypothetical protein WBF39_04085 [Planococcus donghaensis]